MLNDYAASTSTSNGLFGHAPQSHQRCFDLRPSYPPATREDGDLGLDRWRDHRDLLLSLLLYGITRFNNEEPMLTELCWRYLRHFSYATKNHAWSLLTEREEIAQFDEFEFVHWTLLFSAKLREVRRSAVRLNDTAISALAERMADAFSNVRMERGGYV